MAANEIDVKEIMTDCVETEKLLDHLKKEVDELKIKGEQYYEQYNAHPPVFLREYSEALDRFDALQSQLERLQALSQEIAPTYQEVSLWLENAKKGTFECKVNLFKKPHTQRDLNKENNVLATSAPITTLKFVYADDKDQPVDDGFIFYWVYDDLKTEEIEEDHYTKFTLDARPMLPVGVGRTDKNGHLRKSMAFEQDAFSHVQDGKKHYLKLNLQWDGNLNIFHRARGKSFNELVKQSEQAWNALGQLSGNHRFYMAHGKNNKIRYVKDLSNADLSLQNIYSFYLEQEDFEKAESIIRKVKGDKSSNFIKRISNRYFYLTKPYGFMCYPIDRGSFVSKDLHTLTQAENNQTVAWKGMLTPGNGRTSEDSTIPQTTIAIHCTLTEWDRRIQRQNKRLKDALDVYLTNMQPHKKAMDHLDGMLQAAIIYDHFLIKEPPNPDEVKKPDKKNKSKEEEKSEALIKHIQTVQEAIETALEEKSSNNTISVKEELDDVEEQATQLRKLLKSKALLTEYKRYTGEKGPQENAEHVLRPGPDMQEEPYWMHFYQTYCEAIILLRSSPLGSKIFKEDINPFLDGMVKYADFTDLEPGSEVADLIKETDKFFAGQTDEVNINRDDNDENKVKKKLWDRVLEINKKKNNEETDEEDQYKYDEKDSLLYVMITGWHKTSGILFHRVPGPPSVLQVVLDVYADHISKKMQRAGLKGGKGSEHIQLMMVICNYFGVFGEDKANFKKNRDALYTALRAHGRLHKSGGINSKGEKNYYSISALKARIQYMSGEFGKDLTKSEKESLQTVMESVGNTKKFIYESFKKRPFPGFGVNPKKNTSFSDTVYTANNHFPYKTVMAIINLSFMIESWINLPERKTKEWDEGEYLRYIATVTDSLGQSAVTVYNTSALVTKFKLVPLVTQMNQAKQNGLLFWQDSKKTLDGMSRFMDNFAASLSLISVAVTIADGLKYQDRGQTDKAMASWLEATAAGMTAYGFYAGKYSGQGAFAYLSGKASIRMTGILSRSGLALFLPYIGEAVALVGAILSVFMLLYDVVGMIADYNKSTLVQKFDFHFKGFHGLDKDPYLKLNAGKVKKALKSIADYNGLVSGLKWDNLNMNALVPLLSLGTPLEQIRDMLDNNDLQLITEVIHLSERVSDPDLSEHYYIIDDAIDPFPEIARRLNNGTFFDTGLSPYQQREVVLTQYARYREYPRP